MNNARNDALTTSNQYTKVAVAAAIKELKITIDTARLQAVSTSNRYTDSRFQQGRQYTNKRYPFCDQKTLLVGAL